MLGWWRVFVLVGMDLVLKDLSVVGQVPRHGRISSDRDGLYLERASPLLCCKRYMWGDSRTQLIRDLKQLVERVALLHDTAPDLVDVLVTECVAGLDRLHDTTYSTDAVMRSHLKIQAGNLKRAIRPPDVPGRQAEVSESRRLHSSPPSQSYASGSFSQASQQKCGSSKVST